MRFFYLSTIILFVLSQGTCNLFPTKMNTISKGNERNKRKRINKKPPLIPVVTKVQAAKNEI